MISLEDLKNNIEHYDFCKKLYEEAFPKEERWDFDMTIKNEENNNYIFYVILDNDKPIGLTMIWDLDDFYYGEYLAIDNNLRGNNYGSQALTNILELLKDKLFVIEVEPYELNDIAKRRIDWYKRFSFILSEYEYNMPCITENNAISSIEMKIMTWKKNIDKDKHEHIIKKLYDSVYKARLDKIDQWK